VGAKDKSGRGTTDHQGTPRAQEHDGEAPEKQGRKSQGEACPQSVVGGACIGDVSLRSIERLEVPAVWVVRARCHPNDLTGANAFTPREAGG
jgi:hypothetical protein